MGGEVPVGIYNEHVDTYTNILFVFVFLHRRVSCFNFKGVSVSTICFLETFREHRNQRNLDPASFSNVRKIQVFTDKLVLPLLLIYFYAWPISRGSILVRTSELRMWLVAWKSEFNDSINVAELRKIWRNLRFEKLSWLSKTKLLAVDFRKRDEIFTLLEFSGTLLFTDDWFNNFLFRQIVYGSFFVLWLRINFYWKFLTIFF